MKANRRTWAEPQYIVEQVHSSTHSTQSILSRLQTICPGDVRNCDSRLGHNHYGFNLVVALSELGPKPISFHVSPRITLLSSMDSDLEAFSHNPTDGSFTALAGLPTVFTNYLNQLFLSY